MDQASPLPLLRGTNTLLIGPPGSGKTWSVHTLLRAGLKVAVLITDPRGEETLIDSCQRTGTPMENLHWHYVAPATPSFQTLKQMAMSISSMGYMDLANLKTGLNKQDYQQFYTMLEVLSNFTCQRCGATLGPIDALGPDWAFVLDSLSGVNTMCMRMVTGAKPTAHQGEWGVAMSAEEFFLDKLTADLKCFFVLTAHVEKEHDELTGGTIQTAALLGRKLAPKVPRNFSDVILARKEGDKFFWSTTATNVDLKARTLPFSDKIEPDFGQIVETAKQRTLETAS